MFLSIFYFLCTLAMIWNFRDVLKSKPDTTDKVMLYLIGSVFIFTLGYLSITSLPIGHRYTQLNYNSAVEMFDGKDTCVLVNFASDKNNNKRTYLKLPDIKPIMPPVEKLKSIEIEETYNVFGIRVSYGDTVKVSWKLSAGEAISYVKYTGLKPFEGE